MDSAMGQIPRSTERISSYGRPIFILFVCFVLLSSSFFHRLISAVADWMYTVRLHMAWP